MALAVWRFNNRITTEVEIAVLGVAKRPVASFRGERDDRSSSLAQAGEGAHLGARRDGLLWRRHGGRLAFDDAVRLSGDRGDCFGLGHRDHPRGQKIDHKADGVGNTAVAVLPTPDVPRGDVKQSGGAALGDAERVERRAEFGRSC